MKKIFFILAAFMLAAPGRADEQPTKPAISQEVAQKLAAIPVQMPIIDKNGFDISDQEVTDALEEFRKQATEIGIVISEDGQPLVSKAISSATFSSAMEFEVSLNGKTIGKFETRKGAMIARATLGSIFAKTYARGLKLALGGALARGGAPAE